MSNVDSLANIEQALLAEENVFQQLLPELLEKHEGQFAAIYQGQIVAIDRSDEALAQTCYDQLGDVSFLIARIEENESTYEVPSPETD